jgi:hypothetical protein
MSTLNASRSAWSVALTVSGSESASEASSAPPGPGLRRGRAERRAHVDVEEADAVGARGLARA